MKPSMPAALAALEAAIAQEHARVDALSEARSDDDHPYDDTRRPHDDLSLRQRAWRFMAMIRQARIDQQAIVWHV